MDSKKEIIKKKVQRKIIIYSGVFGFISSTYIIYSFKFEVNKQSFFWYSIILLAGLILLFIFLHSNREVLDEIDVKNSRKKNISIVKKLIFGNKKHERVDS